MGFLDDNMKAELEKMAGEAAKEAIDGKAPKDIASGMLGSIFGGGAATPDAPTDDENK